MSKNGHKNGLYVDTGLLRDHISKIQKEKELAFRLYESVAAMKTVDDPTTESQYDTVLRNVDQLIEYFDGMINQLCRIHDEAIELSYELRGMIEDSTQLTKHIIAEQLVI